MPTLPSPLLVDGNATSPRAWFTQAFGNITAIDGSVIAAASTTENRGVTLDTAFTLQNTPADFLSMSSPFNWQVRYRADNALGDDTLTFGIRVVSGATILAAANSGGAFQTVRTGVNTTWPTILTTSSTTAFTYVNTTATKTQWDAAQIELRSTHSTNMGPDDNWVAVDYVELTGSYVASTPTAQPNALETTVEISQPTVTTDEPHSSNIPHTYVEGGHRLGPFCDDNGNLYIFLEVDEPSGQPFMLKSSDGGNTWAEVDQAGRPAQTDMEGTDIRLVDHVLHIGVQGPGSDDVLYYTFHVSSNPTNPDTWQLNELVTANIDPTEQTTCLEVRSDNTVVIGYGGAGPTTDHVRYKIRSSGGSWGSEVVIDSSDTTNTYNQIASVMDANELIHFFYYSEDISESIFTRTLNTSDQLEATRRTVTTGAITDGPGGPQPIIPPISYSDGGNEVVKVAYQVNALTVFWREIVNAGAASSAEQVSHTTVASNVTGMNSRQAVFSLTHDAAIGEFHAIYVNGGADPGAVDNTRTLYHRGTDGGTWQTEEVFQNGGIDCHAVRSEIFQHSVTNGGKRVLGVYWDTGSAGASGSQYDEYFLPDTGVTVTPNDLLSDVNISQPSLIQQHFVTADSLETTVEVSESVIIQTHFLTSDSLETSVEISQPAILQTHIIAPNSLLSDVEISELVITQLHIVAADSLEITTEISQPSLLVTSFANPNSLETTTEVSQPTTILLSQTNPDSLLSDIEISQPALLVTSFANPDSLLSDIEISQPSLLVTSFANPNSLETTTEISQPIVTATGSAQPNSLSVDVETSQPTLIQQHFLTSNDLEVSTEISESLLLVISFANPNSLETTIEIAQPTLQQLHFLTPNSLETSVEISRPQTTVLGSANPQSLSIDVEVSQSTLQQLHFLTPSSLETSVEISQPATIYVIQVAVNSLETSVEVSQSTLLQQHFLTPNSLETSVEVTQPIVSSIGTAQPESLSITIETSQPTLIQQHFLTPNSLETSIEISRPNLSIIGTALPLALVVDSEILQPSLIQQHFLTPDSLETSTEVSQPTVQIVPLVIPENLETSVDIFQPVLLQTHILTPNSLETTIEISRANVSVTGIAQPQVLEITTEISVTSLIQQHFLTPNSLETTIEISQPSTVEVYTTAPNSLEIFTEISQTTINVLPIPISPQSLLVDIDVSQSTLLQQHFLTPNSLETSIEISGANVSPSIKGQAQGNRIIKVPPKLRTVKVPPKLRTASV